MAEAEAQDAAAGAAAFVSSGGGPTWDFCGAAVMPRPEAVVADAGSEEGGCQPLLGLPRAPGQVHIALADLEQRLAAQGLASTMQLTNCERMLALQQDVLEKVASQVVLITAILKERPAVAVNPRSIELQDCQDAMWGTTPTSRSVASGCQRSSPAAARPSDLETPASPATARGAPVGGGRPSLPRSPSMTTWAQVSSFYDDDQDNLKFSCVERVVRSGRFNLVCVLMAALNAVACAVQADWEVNDAFSTALNQDVGSRDRTKTAFLVLQIIIMAWLVVELALNLAAHRSAFLCGSSWRWNAFDAVIVVCAFVDLTASGGGLVASFKVVRCVRLGKLLQVVKFVKFFNGLQKMMISLTSCLSPLFWSLTIMFIIMYMFSIILMQGVTVHVLADQSTARRLHLFHQAADEGTLEDLRHMYGSFGRCMLTLLRGITGADWSAFAQPLVKASYAFVAMWIIYIIFMVFCVLNILTGIFVDCATKAAEKDCTVAVQEQLAKDKGLEDLVKNVFLAMDKDASGALTKEEFDVLMSNTKIVTHLSSVGIETKRAHGLFSLLDDDQSGSLMIDEVVDGLLEIQGEAKAAELLSLRKDVKRLGRAVVQMRDALRLLTSDVASFPTTGSQDGQVAYPKGCSSANSVSSCALADLRAC